ncbi:MAG TPA: pseudouridine-5'-phosphate glycosidase, partial [Blastocatellia bacterium]|nr:pseudouridine-5'-phosphate glycosidase [Blastocatellia bacterium]
LASREMGATTVATSLTLARAAGIQVFSTGGIGGVHRGVEQTFDVSADLTALASTPVICVCSGAKAILDLPRTVELLETTGVPIVGFKATEFAAFYSRSSGLPVDYAAESAADVARFATVHWGTGANTAVLVSAPVPEEFEIDSKEVQSAVATALALAEENGIRGKEVTPYLLAQLERLTSSRSLKANRALLINNARIAASIAKALRMGGAKGRMGEGAEGRTERIQ